MSLRVTGGTLRGRRLTSPRGDAVRPTSARVREALFSILGQSLEGRMVLDLFAGAGTLGIEAASRGAAGVVFVERARQRAELLRSNLALLDGLAEAEVVIGDAVSAPQRLARQGRRFDIVFLDPPYGQGLAAQTLMKFSKHSEELFNPDARLVAEIEAGAELPAEIGHWGLAQRRQYGQTELAFYDDQRRST